MEGYGGNWLGIRHLKIIIIAMWHSCEKGKYAKAINTEM